MSDANWFPNGYEVNPEERVRWLDVRRNGVGASEAAVLLGYPMYGKTAVAIWAEKSGLRPAWSGNEDTRAGKELESVVADIYGRETGRRIVKREVFHRYREFDRCPLFATIDGIDDSGRIVEIKTINEFQEKRKLKDGLPEAWNIQVQAQMLCSGIRESVLAAYLRGSESVVYFPITRDAVIQDEIVEAVSRFWEHVASGVHPPVEEASDLALIPQGHGETVRLGGDCVADADRLKAIQKQIAELEKEKESVRRRLAVALNGNTFGLLPDGRIVESKIFITNHKAREASQSTSVRITIKEPKS